MEEFRVSIHDFLSRVGTIHGLTIDFIDSNCRRCLAENEDFVIFVGPHSDRYTIPIESIREYYTARDKPREKARESAPLAPEFKFDDQPAQTEKKPARGR
jgi:hypothetical protein